MENNVPMSDNETIKEAIADILDGGEVSSIVNCLSENIIGRFFQYLRRQAQRWFLGRDISLKEFKRQVTVRGAVYLQMLRRMKPYILADLEGANAMEFGSEKGGILYPTKPYKSVTLLAKELMQHKDMYAPNPAGSDYFAFPPDVSSQKNAERCALTVVIGIDHLMSYEKKTYDQAAFMMTSELVYGRALARTTPTTLGKEVSVAAGRAVQRRFDLPRGTVSPLTPTQKRDDTLLLAKQSLAKSQAAGAPKRRRKAKKKSPTQTPSKGDEKKA